jgi:hypothetical protein
MRCRLLAILLTLHATVAAAQYTATTSPPTAHRGDVVTVTFTPQTPAPPAIKKAFVTLDRDIALVPGGSTATTSNFTFEVPEDTPLRTYRLKFALDESAVPTTATLRVAMPAPPKVTAAQPSEWFPKGNDLTLTVFGENFSTVKEDNILAFKDRKIFKQCVDGQTDDCVNVEVVDGRQLTFSNISFDAYAGRQHLVVRVGDQSSIEDVSVLISKVPRKAPILIAAVVLLAIVAIVAVMVIIGRAKATPKRSVWAALLIDPTTNSYSLSTAQFYLWTAAAILGYAFLTAAYYLVQGKFELPEVPEGLPGLLAISAGTTIIASGVDNDRTKGAGTQKASLGDLVTTGGIVVPDRVQFLVWTLIGVFAFVALVWMSNPGTIKDLPRVPDGMMYLMGISSLGYLGGKFARQPGPVITAVSANGAGDLVVTGRNIQTVNVTVDGMPVTAVGTDEEDRTGFFRTLTIAGKAPAANAKPVVIVRNTDGQKAEKTFP